MAYSDFQNGKDLYTDIQTSAVHIPECDPKCNIRLSQVGNALRSRGVCCALKYQPNGLYVTSFEKNFAEFTFTILHTCPSLWKKLHRCKYILSSSTSKFVKKIVVVTWDDHQQTDNAHSSLDGFDQFFNKFKPQDISDDHKLNAFVEDITAELQKSRSAPRRTSTPVPDADDLYSNVQEDLTSTFDTLGDLQKSQSLPRNQRGLAFSLCPDIFGGTEHQDSAVFMNRLESQTREAATFFAMCEGRKKTADALTQEIDNFLKKDQICKKDIPAYSKRVRFIIEKILPTFYTKNDPLGLACTAVCKEPEIQKRALTLLERSILKLSESDDEISLKTLFEICRRLTSSVRALSRESKAHSQLVKNQTFNVLLMLLTETAMACNRTSGISQWDSLVKELKPMLVERTTKRLFKLNEQAKIFVKFLVKPNKSMMQTVHTFTQSSNQSGEKLCQEKSRIQFAVILECLKEIFAKRDETKVEFLRVYADLAHRRNSLTLRNKHPPRTCILLILLGMSHFLAHISREAADCNIQEISRKGIDLISVAYKRDLHLPDWICYMLKQLMFNNLPVVRMRAHAMLVERFEETVEVQLFNGVYDRLCPLLEIEANLMVPEVKEGQWLNVLGSFNGQKVKVVLHKSLTEDHWHMNETKFTDVQDKRHSNQVAKLKSLEHPHIQKIFADLMDHIPQFYVVEHGRSLQEIMKNLNENIGRSKLSDLLKYLVQCAGALEYCHSKQILHGNLTAACLNLVGDKAKTVKLGSLEHAIELKTGEQKKSSDQDIDNIPTRWSAPETLRTGIFSELTDSWMLGCLIFEVLSHGALPFLNMEEAKLVWKLYPQVTHGPPMLDQETCIQQEHFRLILECIELDPKKRPSISKIKRRLEKFHKESLEKQTWISCKKRWKDSGSSSTEVHRGIPSDVSKFYNIHYSALVLHETKGKFSIFKTDFGYIVRQKIKRMISVEFHMDIACVLPWLFFPLYSACEDESVYELESFLSDSHLPVSNIENLQSVAENRLFGENLQSYMNLLLQVAEQLQELHQKSLILGDFTTLDFFLDPSSTNAKVYTVGVENLQLYNQDTEDVANLPYKNIGSGNRPVIKSLNGHSPASDIACFGRLVMDIFQELGIKVCNFNFKRRSKQRRLRPPNCCRPLYDQAKLCIDKDETKRPSLAKMITEIKELINGDLKKRTKVTRESTTDSECSLTDASFKQPLGVKEINPSDFSLTSEEETSSDAGAHASYRHSASLKTMNSLDSSKSTQSSTSEMYRNIKAHLSHVPGLKLSALNPSDPSDSSQTSTDDTLPKTLRPGVPDLQGKGKSALLKKSKPKPSKYAPETKQTGQKFPCSCSFFGPREQPDQRENVTQPSGVLSDFSGYLEITSPSGQSNATPENEYCNAQFSSFADSGFYMSEPNCNSDYYGNNLTYKNAPTYSDALSTAAATPEKAEPDYESVDFEDGDGDYEDI